MCHKRPTAEFKRTVRYDGCAPWLLAFMNSSCLVGLLGCFNRLSAIFKKSVMDVLLGFWLPGSDYLFSKNEFYPFSGDLYENCQNINFNINS